MGLHWTPKVHTLNNLFFKYPTKINNPNPQPPPPPPTPKKNNKKKTTKKTTTKNQHKNNNNNNISCIRSHASPQLWGFGSLTTSCDRISNILLSGRKEGNIVFNDALNSFYLRLYGVGHMVKGPLR